MNRLLALCAIFAIGGCTAAQQETIIGAIFTIASQECVNAYPNDAKRAAVCSSRVQAGVTIANAIAAASTAK